MAWIHVAHIIDRWWAFVKKVINIRKKKKNVSDILTNKEIIGFKRTMLHGITCGLHRHVRKYE
jgi:hypothetical protein